MSYATKLPWKTALACSGSVGLLALRAVALFHPKPVALACLTLWGGPHLGPFAAFAFSDNGSVTDVLLGCLMAALILLPVRVEGLWARVLGTAALISWFLCGIGYVYSGI